MKLTIFIDKEDVKAVARLLSMQNKECSVILNEISEAIEDSAESEIDVTKQVDEAENAKFLFSALVISKLADKIKN